MKITLPKDCVRTKEIGGDIEIEFSGLTRADREHIFQALAYYGDCSLSCFLDKYSFDEILPYLKDNFDPYDFVDGECVEWN